MGNLSFDALWAHTPADAGSAHALLDHLTGTADLARGFAARMGFAELGELLGLWHDIGKAHPKFQRYLKDLTAGRSGTSVPHAIWGAALAYGFKDARGPWRELTVPIAGHHAGLKSPRDLENDIPTAVEREPDVYDTVRKLAARLPMPAELQVQPAEPAERELRIRMLLSALVDADRLDTEAHADPEHSNQRGFEVSAEHLWAAFENDQQELMAGADDTRLNDIRRDVYEACLAAAHKPQGVYRLTVPTGGGKTRSGLAFALRHAMEHELERVIAAIPYTSIIDQTADVYRRILGDDVVLEHHSRAGHRSNREGGEEDQTRRTLRLRLATENWDAPLIVTTTVQLFESLFSHNPSAVRKIHRIANSVVILDEVQTLPPGLLDPTTDVLRGLVKDYGATIVLSTATQPALDRTPYIESFDGMEIREIVPSHPEHFEILKRVRYQWIEGSPDWPELAERLNEQDQVLAVLNTRRDALALLDSMPSHEDTYHLSSLLCAAHRRDQLRRVRCGLEAERPVRVVSTQVVEAGVDIDFPVVFRALGPLDRIVQAAGRCNREGRRQKGRVYLFDPGQGGSPRGAYRTGLGHARALLQNSDLERLHDPRIFRTYFQRLFRDQELDENGVQPLRRKLRFRDVSDRYRLIDDDTVPVVVNYRERGHDLAMGFWERPSREGFVRLQPYVVNLYPHQVDQYRRAGWITPLGEGTDLCLWEGEYDELYGIRETVRNPADLVL